MVKDEMLGATIHWQPPQGETYTLTADRATLEQNSGDLRLSQDFGWCVQPLLLSLK